MMDEYKVTDDGIYKNTPCGTSVYKTDLIMPKDVFIEAFNEYIRFQPIGRNQCQECHWSFSSNDDSDSCPHCGSTNVKPICKDILGNLYVKI